VKNKLTKKKRKEIEIISKMLPILSKQVKRTGTQYGSFILAQNIEMKDKDGKEINPKMKYTCEWNEAVRVNHKRRLLNTFKGHGQIGIISYCTEVDKIHYKLVKDQEIIDEQKDRKKRLEIEKKTLEEKIIKLETQLRKIRVYQVTTKQAIMKTLREQRDRIEDINRQLNFMKCFKVNNGKATLTINDEIGFWGISEQGFKAEMKEIDDDTDIKLEISSLGGDINQAKSIYNMISSHKGEISCRSYGDCASSHLSFRK